MNDNDVEIDVYVGQEPEAGVEVEVFVGDDEPEDET